MLNKLGDRIAGQRKRKKIQAEMRLSLMSWRPDATNLSRNSWKHSLNSLKQMQKTNVLFLIENARPSFAAGLHVVVSRTADKGKDCNGKSILVAQS